MRPAFALEGFTDLEADVRQSIERIQVSPFVPRKESVRGFVYEVETGRLARFRRTPPRSCSPGGATGAAEV